MSREVSLFLNLDEEPLVGVQVGPALTVTVVTPSAPTVVLLAARSLPDFLAALEVFFLLLDLLLEVLTRCKYLLAASHFAEEALLLVDDELALRREEPHFLAVRFAALTFLLLTRRRYFCAFLTCCFSVLDRSFLPLAERTTARALSTFFCSFWDLSSLLVQAVGVGVTVVVTVLEG